MVWYALVYRPLSVARQHAVHCMTEFMSKEIQRPQTVVVVECDEWPIYCRGDVNRLRAPALVSSLADINTPFSKYSFEAGNVRLT